MTTTTEIPQTNPIDGEELDVDMNDVINSYIAVLLDRFDELNDREGEYADEILGMIRIVIDDGITAEYLNSKYTEGQGMLLLSVLSTEQADDIEALLVQWSFDSEALEDVVKSFRPDYPNSEGYYDYIDIVTEEIAEILLQAMIIPADSILSMRLHEAALQTETYRWH